MLSDRVEITGGLESEIVAEARETQGRHVPRLWRAAARRLRHDRVTGERAAAERAVFEARRSIAH